MGVVTEWSEWILAGKRRKRKEDLAPRSVGVGTQRCKGAKVRDGKDMTLRKSGKDTLASHRAAKAEAV